MALQNYYFYTAQNLTKVLVDDLWRFLWYFLLKKKCVKGLPKNIFFNTFCRDFFLEI